MILFAILYSIGFIFTILYYIAYNINCVENGEVSFSDIIFCSVLSSVGWLLVPMIGLAELIEKNYGESISKFFNTPLFKSKDVT
ncbi:hypothetical protein pEaSNUABM44_00088 [Erwinia phage pEa_SNUABM_44]|nr:hypothetical protein pEaSNUABM44_00088 [Erwinia phage pEa_SNUABM_44]